MPSSSKFKAQFIMLSVVAIVSVLYLFSLWARPADVIDLSSQILVDEYFLMQNMANNLKYITSIDDCEVLNYSLQEYIQFVKGFAKEKNIRVDLFHNFSNCSQKTVEYNITIYTPNRNISSRIIFTR